MRPRRPRRRGDWGRHLSTLSIVDSPISSDSDGFPCESSCSGDSFSSQDYYSHQPRRDRVRSSLPTQLSPVSLPSLEAAHPHPLPHPHAHAQQDMITPRPLASRHSQVDIRDMSLSEYAAAELPDLGILFRGMIPGITAVSPQVVYPLNGASSSSANGLPRRKSMPHSILKPSSIVQTNSRSGTPGDRMKNGPRPPAFPDSCRPMPNVRMQLNNKYEALQTVLSARDQVTRKEGSRRMRRSSPHATRTAKLSPKIDTRRFADDIAISRLAAMSKDPDSMHRSLLLERLQSLYNGLFNHSTAKQRVARR